MRVLRLYKWLSVLMLVLALSTIWNALRRPSSVAIVISMFGVLAVFVLSAFRQCYRADCHAAWVKAFVVAAPVLAMLCIVDGIVICASPSYYRATVAWLSLARSPDRILLALFPIALGIGCMLDTANMVRPRAALGRFSKVLYALIICGIFARNFSERSPLGAVLFSVAFLLVVLEWQFGWMRRHLKNR